MSTVGPFDETAFVFPCSGEILIGVIAAPSQPSRIGVLVVVGGPQYRIGSHRQFVHLARHLAARGVACMRFDYRGMGDSTGAMRTFEEVSEDIRAALDAFLARSPGMDRVLLWGLCDGASAATFYACGDARVSGLILANPWVRTAAGEAEAHLRHYYIRRILDPSFWKKVLRGKFSFGSSVGGLAGTVRAARALNAGQDLPDRFAARLASFRGRLSLLMSGDDLTAAEFRDRARRHAGLRRALAACDARWVELGAVDHTFSSRSGMEQVARATSELLLDGTNDKSS